MKITHPTKPLISIKEEVKNLNFWKDTFAKSKQQKSQKMTQTGFNRFQVRNLNVKYFYDGEHHDGSNWCSIGSIIVERDDVGTRGGTIERKSSVWSWGTQKCVSNWSF